MSLSIYGVSSSQRLGSLDEQDLVTVTPHVHRTGVTVAVATLASPRVERSGLRREAAFRDAEAREREAEAEAKATLMVSDAIAKSGTQALNYFIAQKYTEAVSQFATSPNAKTILFPVEATQLIGSVGGIGELVKDALGERKG